MSRAHRPYSPGVPFHVTARVQGRAPLFVGLEPTVAALIRSCAERADGDVLAYAVMPNHLHLVYVQGRRPLSAYVQPLLTRVAMLLRRAKGHEGHAFERRFRATACTSADYLRNAIAYVHLNAVRAGLCVTADEHAWSGHADMCVVEDTRTTSRIAGGRVRALQLFAPAIEAPRALCVDSYRAFLDWRMRMDEHLASADGQRGIPGPRSPDLPGGDVHWYRVFAPACEPLDPRGGAVRKRPDLRDFMKEALQDLEPGMSLDLLRSGGRTKPLVRARSTLIVRARERGYTGRAIASFLHISQTAVSRQLGTCRE